MENDNKRLHEWFGLCFHEIKGGLVRPARCVKGCGFRVSIAEWQMLGEQANPNYSTESGFFALLDGLRAKVVSVEMWTGANTSANILTENGRYIAIADPLYEALFQAAIKAMDAETK